MIAQENVLSTVVRWTARFTWSGRAGSKLLSFAATESGSALDMFKAAELCPDPKQRRLFFRHALDEARHAKMFLQAAEELELTRLNEYDRVRATRQNLYRSMDPIEFVAFVHLAEKMGEAHFLALFSHFKGQPNLEQLFAKIAKDERFHVSYSARLLQEWRKEGRGKEVRRALQKVQWTGAWRAWRRAGRRIGDLLSRAVINALYFTVVPVFALLCKRLDPARPGWKKREVSSELTDARRQF